MRSSIQHMLCECGLVSSRNFILQVLYVAAVGEVFLPLWLIVRLLSDAASRRKFFWRPHSVRAREWTYP